MAPAVHAVTGSLAPCGNLFPLRRVIVDRSAPQRGWRAAGEGHDMELYRDGATLHIVGQVDGRGTAALRDAIRTQLDTCDGDVILDAAEVESVDLIALRTIAVASREATLHGQRVLLRNCPPMFRRLLHLSRMRGLVTYESESHATAV